MFKCRLCLEKDSRRADLVSAYEARIEELKAQIEDLRSFTIPKPSDGPIPIVQVEADAILSGKEEVTYEDDDQDSPDAVASEASRLLSGTY